MISYVFPGQGAQHSGMGKILCERYQLATEIFKSADNILGYSLSEIMFNGTEEELKQTKYTQLAMFLFGYAACKCLGNTKLPDMIAGHSLGEYTALAVAECLSFEDALKLVEKRATAMQKACEKQESGMAVVLKFDDKKTEEICAAIADEIVVPANYNSPQQLVISGTMKGIDIAIEALKNAGATRIMMLNVSGAFHSPLMKPAQDELAEVIEKCTFNKPVCAVYQNVTSLPTREPQIIKNNLIAQLTSPVRWTESVANMVADGANSFVEFSSKPVLQALIKRINPNVSADCEGVDM